MATQRLDPTRGWLGYCDQQIAHPEGVDFLKLGLFSELASKYHKLDELQHPSEVYNLLCECYRQKDSTIPPLQVFVHVLRQTGRYLRGKWVVGKLSNYGIQECKSLSCTEVSKDFLFFQCLVRIASKVRTTPNEEKMRNHFSRENRLDVSPELIRNLPHMFMLLHQKKVISCDDTSILEMALHRYKEYRRLGELYEYKSSVGLISEYEPNCSGNESSDSQSGPPSAYTSDPGAQERRRRRLFSDGYTSRLPPVQVSSGGAVPDDESDDSDRGDNGDTNDSENLLPPDEKGLLKSTSSAGSGVNVGFPTEKGVGKAGKCCLCVLWSIATLLIIAMLVLMLTLVWWNIIFATKIQQVKVYEDHTIVLKELNQFYHRSLKITEEVEIHNSWFETEIFVLPLSCKHYNTYTTTSTIHGVNVTEFENSSWYLMPGSKLHYTFTATSNSSVVNERIHVYLVRGLMIPDKFNPNDNQNSKAVVKKGRILVGNLGIRKTTPFSYNITEWDFYSLFVFLPQNHTVQYSFDFTVEQRMINLAFVEDNSEQNCTLDEDSYCTVNAQKFQRGEKCVLASVKNDSDSRYSQTHIKVETEFWFYRALASTAIPVVTVIAVLLAVLVVSTYWCCCRARNSRAQEEMTTFDTTLQTE